jgi:hypothetical protein
MLVTIFYLTFQSQLPLFPTQFPQLDDKADPYLDMILKRQRNHQPARVRFKFQLPINECTQIRHFSL